METVRAKSCRVILQVPFYLIFLLVVLFVLNTTDKVNARQSGCMHCDIKIKTNSATGIISEKFLSVAIDTSFFRKHNISYLLRNHKFVRMMTALKPAILRVGGTAADLLMFEEDCEKNTKNEIEVVLDKRSNASFVLCGRDWVLLNNLVLKSGLSLLFDLNVLQRTSKGNWNSTNAQKLLTFSQKNDFHIDWELGNEPNSFWHVFGISIPPKQLAKDFRSLSELLSQYPIYQNSALVGPDITAPRKSRKFMLPPLPYLDGFLLYGKKYISAVTWHQYYVNGRNTSKEAFMDYSTLNILAHEIKAVKSIVSRHLSTHFPVWISETSSAWGGGAQGLSDHFVSTFMWLDKLGMAAKLNISLIIRQALIGDGHYSLIDIKTFDPNPDFWVSVVYKMIVGQIALKVTIKTEDPNVRLYAHCTSKSLMQGSNDSLVVFGMNLGGVLFNGSIQSSVPLYIDEYRFTAPGNHLLSRNILLNGELMKLTQSGEIPPLKALKYKSKNIILHPYALSFFVVHGISAPACG